MLAFLVLKLANLCPIFLPFDFASVATHLLIWVFLTNFVSVAPENEEEENWADDPSTHHENGPQITQKYWLGDLISPFNANRADERGHQHGQVSHQDHIDDRAPEEEALHVEATSFGQHVAHLFVTKVAEDHDE